MQCFAVSRDKRTRDGDSDADTSMATAAATDMDGVEGGEEVASSGSKHPRAAADLDIPAKSAVKGLQLSVPEDNALPCLVHVGPAAAPYHRTPQRLERQRPIPFAAGPAASPPCVVPVSRGTSCVPQSSTRV